MITKEQFKKFERVRRSGVTNMFDINKVKELTGLTKEQLIWIMKDYDYYRRKFYGDK